MRSASPSNGGASAAAGFLYQYLRTLERFMDYTDEDPVDVVLRSEDTVAEKVDFSVARDGKVLELAQVKSTMAHESGRRLSARELLANFAGMTSVEAEQYVLYTNRPLTQEAAEINVLLGRTDTKACERILNKLEAMGAEAGCDEWSPQKLVRLRRCHVRTEAVSAADILERLTDRIVQFRQRNRMAVTTDVAQILLRRVICDVFEQSAAALTDGITAGRFGALLGTSEHSLASAVGAYQWGNPVGALPPEPELARADLLEQMLSRFHGLPSLRVPRSLVLTGLSGIGKSCTAASFAHRYGSLYDWIVWIDCSQQESVRMGIQAMVRLMGHRDSENLSDAQLSQMFRSELAASAATWLVVMDNATSARSLEAWLPTMGRVDLIATSIDASAWTDWASIDVCTLDKESSKQLIRRRLEDRPGHEDVTQQLCDELKGWPLAIDVACAFLRSSERPLRELTAGYLIALRAHALANPSLTPAPYKTHPSLVAAITLAFEQLAAEPALIGPLTSIDVLHTVAFSGVDDAPLRFVAMCASHQASARVHDATWVDDTALEMAQDLGVLKLVSKSLARRHELFGFDALSTNAIVREIARAWMSSDSVVETLTALQFLGSNVLERLLDDELFLDLRVVAPTLNYINDQADARGALVPEGILILGNLGKFHIQQGDFLTAQKLYERELEQLRHAGDSGPIIIALAESAIVGCAYQSSTDPELLLSHAEAAIDAFEDAAARPEAISSVEEFAAQLEQLRLTFDSPALDPIRDRLVSLSARASAAQQALGVGENPLLELDGRVQGLLSAYRGREAARLLEKELGSGAERSSSGRVRILAQLVEAYSYFDPARSISSIATAASAATQAGLTVQVIVGELLNAWTFFVSRELSQPANNWSPRFADEFAGQIDVQQIVDPMDRYRYLLACAGTLALHGQLPTAEHFNAEAQRERPKSPLQYHTGAFDLLEYSIPVLIHERERFAGARFLYSRGGGIDQGDSRAPRVIALSLESETFTQLAEWADEEVEELQATWISTRLGLAASITGAAGLRVVVLVWRSELCDVVSDSVRLGIVPDLLLASENGDGVLEITCGAQLDDI